jgi:crotonobetainyl-CoA:carnitine CoA-transferase CaiB-like acyl-CoA transferase
MATAPKRPFQGLRILELSSQIAGPYAGKLFVDAGAEGTKVESPGGDPMRRWSASFQSIAPGESSPLFQFLNAGKRSIALDPGDAQDRERLAALAVRADIVIEDWGPGALEAMGLDPEAWLATHPGLVVVRISPWGQAGPWARHPANDFTLQAASGSLEYRGFPWKEPVAAGGRVCDWVAGSFAAVSALAAWRSARRDGAGQIVDLSTFEAALHNLTIFGDIGSQFLGGLLPRSIEIPSIEPTKDGHIGICTQTGQQWSDFCSMLGRQDIAEDPRFLEARERFEQIDFMQTFIHGWMKERTSAEVTELCELVRIPVAPIGNGRDLPHFDHFVARGVYGRAPGGFLQPRPPYKLESMTPAPIGPTSRLDGDRAAVLAEITGSKARPIPARRGPMSQPDLPFSGLRVVDLTAFWAGPYTTSILSDLGADVVKVESIQRPDGMRFAGAARHRTPVWEWAHVFHGANPGKRDVTLRLDHPEGVALVKRLIADADVVIENFSARVMPGFGLDSDTLKALNPRLINVRMPAFGLDGPWRDRLGFAMTIEQVSGLAWLTGYEDLPLVVRGLCDPLGSVHTVFALGLALEERERTGKGQVVEVALVEPALNIAAEQVLEYSAWGVLLTRHANRMPHAAPQGIFETKNADERVAISVTNDAQWAGLCRVLGADDWQADRDLATHAGRYAAHDRLQARVSDWARTRARDAIVEALLAAGVPASASINNHCLWPNPQLEARGFFQTMKHPVTGETRYPSFPATFSAFERDLHRTPPPTLGQHNREILQGDLGLSDAEVAHLETAKIIGTRPSFM